MNRNHVTCTINGDDIEFLCDADESLLDALRDEVGITGAKEGCGTGDCGACSVILNGQLICACLAFAPEANGGTIETVEGMADGEKLHPLQTAFLEHAALQCGICTPGFLMAAKVLFQQKMRFGMDSQAICAGVLDTTKLFGQFLAPPHR